MKARVKATGEIIEVITYSGFDDYDYYDPETKLPWLKSQLSFGVTDSDPDYWTRLEHQAAIAAMQGIINNPIGFENLRALSTISALGKALSAEVACLAYEYAHALVEKYKEKEEKK